MKLLATGASGFVGTNLARVTPLLSLDDDSGFLDLNDGPRLRARIAELAPTHVIHLAAQSFVPASFENPKATIDVNLYGTLNLLQALDATGFRGRLLFIGSSEQYGLVPADHLPVGEDHVLCPRNPYAVSKLAAEALCRQWSFASKFEIVMARPFNHIGPGQHENFVVSNFARQVAAIRLGKQPPQLNVGDIDVTRDFTDVRDVIAAYLLLLEKGHSGQVYNVCSGVETSVRAILEQLIALAGVKAQIVVDPSRLRAAEQRRMAGDPARLRSHTGWQPRRPLAQTLRDILDFWEARLNS